MKFLCLPVVSFLLNTISLLSFAQPDLHFTRITSKDGLSGDVVYCILQDKRGFLWIGTHRGLNRYDGYHFTHYMYDPSDTNSISGNNVPCIREDNDGILWLSTNKGLNSLDPITGKIRRYQLPDSRMPSSMEDIILVNDSVLLVNAVTAIYKFNKKTKTFTPVKFPSTEPPLAVDRPARFAKNKSGNIFIATVTKEALFINWQNATSTFLPLRDKWKLQSYDNSKLNAITQIYFDLLDTVWAFSTRQGFLSNEINYPYSVKNEMAFENLISNFYEEPGKRLWICTGAGLVLYDYARHAFYRYRQQQGSEQSLSNNRVTCLTRDKNGTYWAGTFGNGICHFSINPKFKNIIIDTTLNSEDRLIYGLKTLHSGRILVGTMSNKKFLISKEKNVVPLNLKDSVSIDSIISEITGKSKEFFSSENLHGLKMLLNVEGYPDTKKVRVSLKDISTRMIVMDGGYIWYTYGLALIKGYKMIYFDRMISHFAPRDQDHFLLATNNGLLVFNKRTSAVEKIYLPEKNNPYSIGSSFVGGVLPAGKGNFWITTLDAGFDFFDTKANRFYHYTTKDGLPDNTIYCTLQDKHGRLWLSTNNGLSCFDTTTKTFTNYDQSDGLINTEFNSGSGCIGNDGYMYFGGMNGIDYFHPDSLLEVKPPPPVYVSNLKVYDQTQPLADFYKFASNDNNISIEFSANDLLSSSKIFYRHKLEGVDKNWETYKGKNFALYNKLPSGKYHFAVQASYNNKDWGKPLAIDFVIATPWYQTWWFFVLLALLTATAVYLLFRYRLQQQLKILQVRNRIHRDLHDDVGATLSSVKAYSEILRDNPNNPVIAELIKENASQMIEQLEVIAWAANPHHDSFGSLIEKINHYAAPTCSAKNICYDISPDGISRDLLMPGEIRQNVFLIAKEAINNMSKYADAATCTIKSFAANGKFIMEITDDGNGFDGVVKGTGNGLQNMRARAKEIGGEIFIVSEEGKGTKIKLQLSFPFKIPNSWDRKNNGA